MLCPSNYDITSEWIDVNPLLDSTNKSIIAILAQEVAGVEHPIYYLSKSIQGSEIKLPSYNAVVLRYLHDSEVSPFFLSPFNLVTKSNSLKYLLSRLTMSGRVARPLHQLNEFDIIVITHKGIRSQALSNLLAQYPASTSRYMKTYSTTNMFHGDQRMTFCL